MGWWSNKEDGNSDLFATSVGEFGVWGDEPADAFDDALDRVKAAFLRSPDEGGWGRLPSKAEIRLGLEFSLGGDDLPEDAPKGGD